MKKIIFIAAFVFFALSVFTQNTFALINPPRQQLNFNTANKTFSGIFTNSNDSSSIEVLLRSDDYNFYTNQTQPIEYISLGNIPITGGAFTLPLQNNSAFQQLTPGEGNNHFINTSSGRAYSVVAFRIPDPTNSLGLNTGFAELYDSVTISNPSNTTTTSSSSTTTVVPDVIKLSINHSTKKLTGTKTNTVPGATLNIYLYSHLHPTTASIKLGATPGASGNFTIDLSGNSKFNELSVEDGYFRGSFLETDGPGDAVLDKIRVTVDGTTVTKNNLGFTLTNVVNTNTTGTSNTQTNTSGSSNSNSSGLSTGGQTNPSGNGNTPTNSAPAGSNPSGNGNTPFPPGSSSEDIEKLEDPLGEGTTLEGLILKLFEIIMYIGVPLVAFFLIWSGFMFVSAQGNPEKLETARNRLLYTIIGAIILLGAWTISQAIKGTVEDIKSGGQALVTFISHLG